MEELARCAGVPVWNGLTTQFHPTQMLADVMTVEENFGHLDGIKLVFMGDARNNVANSRMVVCAKMGMHFVTCGPKELLPDKELVNKCKEIAKETNGSIEMTEDVMEASKDADVIFLDEPNSALDAISDYEISQLYQKLFQDKMGIIIAHKFNNLINQVNNILVIENGRLAESGTHTDLLHQGKIYYEMYQLQNKNSAVL